MAGLPPRCTVEEAIEVVVGFGVAVANLSLATENLFKNQFGKQARFFSAGDFDMSNFARDVALFIGQEKPQITVAADEALLLKASQTFLNFALKGKLVSVDLVDAQRGKVVDIRFDDIGDVSNEKHRLEQLAVVGLEPRVERRFVNRALGHAIDEAFDGRVEVVDRNQNLGAHFGVAHGG